MNYAEWLASSANTQSAFYTKLYHHQKIKFKKKTDRSLRCGSDCDRKLKSWGGNEVRQRTGEKYWHDKYTETVVFIRSGPQWRLSELLIGQETGAQDEESIGEEPDFPAH